MFHGVAVAEALIGQGPALATVVMYHFVQPSADGPVSGLKSLDPSAFRGQLAYIRRHYTPVSVFDLVRSLQERAPLPPRPIVLTFDDGYRSHHRYVFPMLDRRVLDVNKIQCLLAVTEEMGGLVAAIETAIERERHHSRVRAPSEYRAKWWKPSRWDPAPVAYIKRLLQHALPEPIRRPLLDGLFRELVSRDEAAFADELYMSVGEARELCAAGMTVGAHGDRHVRLPTLSRAEQAREIDGALRVLDALGIPRQGFAYSYANGEYDDNSVALLRECGCRLAFTTRPELARIAVESMLTLPRIDTNDLPTQADVAPNEWTRRAAAATDPS